MQAEFWVTRSIANSPRYPQLSYIPEGFLASGVEMFANGSASWSKTRVELPRLVNDFVHDLELDDLPEAVAATGRRCPLDLIGVGAAGSQTLLAKIIAHHAAAHFGSTTLEASLSVVGHAAHQSSFSIPSPALTSTFHR